MTEAEPALPPRVTVVMCVRDGLPWIDRQLDALEAQQLDEPWEVVVADNGSTDGTQRLVRERAGTFAVPLRLVDAGDRRGASHARNVGALAARGEVLAFCDCDDVVAPGWLAAAERGTRTASLVGGVVRLLGDPLDPDAPVVNPGGVTRASFGNALMSGNFAARRSDFLAVGGFDESLPAYGCEDYEFSIRANEAGLHVVGAPDMQIWFRRTEGLRPLLRKTYSSSLSEAVVWARHPARYGRELGVRPRVTAVLRWPVDVVTGAVARRHLAPRSAARDLMIRVGNLVGWWTLVRTGKAGEPRLLEVEGR